MIRHCTILLGFLVIGCSTTSAPPLRSPNLPEPRSDAAPAPADPHQTPVAEEPKAALTLPDAVALALLKNPELLQYSWQIRADEARVLQAGLRPNPELAVFVEDVLGTGRFHDAQQAQLTLQLSQAIELGGKRAARLAAASRNRELTSREYERERVRVLAEVTRRFIDLLEAQRLVALAGRTVELADQTVAASTRRVQAGAGSLLDERKARIELARGRIVAEHAEHERAVVQRQLAATWASVNPHFTRAEGSLFGRRAVPSYEQLAALVERSPDMLRQISERQLREAELRLAETKRIPTPSVMGGIRRFQGPGDEAFVFGLWFPLPVSDRHQGDRSEARALLAKSEEGARATDVRLRTVLFELHQELRHAAVALDALEREIVPQAEESLALARRGFAEGRFSYLELVDAERTLIAAGKERIETAAAYHRLIVEIESMTGEPVGGTAPDKEAVAP
jgi:cobalt-zinc-cadmium efflux system outer membrane protein